MVSAQQSTGLVCFFPRVYSEKGPRMRWQHCKNPSNKERVVKECTANSAEVCSNSRDMFTTHIEVIVSWWSWKPSSRAPKIESSFSAEPHPRRIISVLCPSMQEGVHWNLPGSVKPQTCWAFSIKKTQLVNILTLPKGTLGTCATFAVRELYALKILPPLCRLVWRARIVAGKNCCCYFLDLVLCRR